MITLDDVRAAAAGLEGVAHRTPVLRSRTLDAQVGRSVVLKAEIFQRTGAFKFRGAYTKLASLSPGERRAGVVAVSSGNHAAAVALAGSLLGVQVTILMPDDAPPAKRAATEGYGAEVITFDRYTVDRDERVAQLVDERGAVLVPPFDDLRVMAGQGTVALELFDEVPDVDVLVVPVGGGGLAAGCATVAAALRPGCRVVGVEPEAGDDTKRSLAAGERVRIDVPRTIADGQQITSPGALTFEVNRRLLASVVTVTDAELVQAMAFLFDRMKLVTEPSGACAVAALLAGRVDLGRGATVAAVLSGGNVGTARFCDLLSDARPVS